MSELPRDDVVQIPLGRMKNLVYLVACPTTGRAAVIDPAWDVGRILAETEDRGWEISTILLTHTHHDHVEGVDETARRTGAPVRVHALEKDGSPVPPHADHLLQDGDAFRIGEREVEVLHTPGHSPGAVCYRSGGALFTGDTLFVGRTGRMVFAGGSIEQMWQSVQRLRELPEDLVVYPGHDYGPSPTSTIGRERRENAFFQPDTLEEFRRVAEDWERRNG